VRVAFVHDYLTQFGGAERVLLEMHRLYPQAPLYTSLVRRQAVAGHFDAVDVRTSFLQQVPGAARHFRALVAFYPLAFSSLDLRGYDLIISSTTAFAKGVRVPPQTLHVCYMNTPTRFLWYPEEYADVLTPAPLRPAWHVLRAWLKRWDVAAAQRPQVIVTNSRHVARRIARIYGRRSEIVPCPVQVPADAEAQAAHQPDGGYFLVLSRLLPYKRIHLAVQACTRARLPLVIAGSGPDEERLRRLAGPSVTFAGWVSDERRDELLRSARAVIVCGVEDFGLVPLEAAARGRPAVAFAAGGALETIVEGETGLFFTEPSPDALLAALEQLASTRFDPLRLVAHARTFAPDVFRSRLSALIETYRARPAEGGAGFAPQTAAHT
jgi:glycosyltransferase involved in cell wall biosynthesis